MNFLVLFLSVLVFCCTVPFSTATTINNALDLVKYFQRSGQSTINGYLELTADIDFSEVSIDYALGEYSGSCIPFSGSLYGNGHSIKNYIITYQTNAGIFCEISSATIQNLIIDESCFFGGTNAGALSPSVLGTVTLTNVINKAIVSGSSSVGGFFSAIIGSTGARIMINNCRNEGQVISESSTTRSGGIIGHVYNNQNMALEIRETSHSGVIYAPYGGPSGGLIGFVYNNPNMNLVIHQCQIDSETTYINEDFTYSYYGGLIGFLSWNSHMKATIEDSTTSGLISGELPNETFIGGFIGKMNRNDNLVMNCARNVNKLNVTIETKTFAGVGGFIGWVERNPSAQMTFENNQNNGNISVTSNNNYVGGFIGYFKSMSGASLVVSSFTQAGSISVYSTPSVLRVGGLIGLIDYPSSSIIRIRNIQCNGPIFTESAFHSYVGSVVGSVANSQKTTFEIDDAVFSGTITAVSLEAHYSYVAGIVGHIMGNRDCSFTLSFCENRGAVKSISKSLYHYLSGFVALFSYNDNTAFSIMNSIHDGPVEEQEVIGECYYGGFIAEVNNNNDTDIVVFNATNSGKWHIETVSDSSQFAGLVGKIRSENSLPVRLYIAHSINKQSLSHSNGPACGLFCVDSNHYDGIQSTVINSINKGDISATSAYGIATSTSAASSVVSMGKTTGTVNSYSLWSSAIKTENIYVLDKTCQNCQSATQFTQGTSGNYVIVGSNQNVNDVLNTISIHEQYGLIWTKELELTTAVRAIFGAPIQHTVFMLPGSTFETVLQIHPFNTEILIPINKTDNTLLDINSVFNVDTPVVLCYRVTLNGIVNSLSLIEHGTVLGNDKTLSQYTDAEYVFVDTLDFNVIYNSATVVVQPMTISVLKVVRVILEIPYIQQTRVVPSQIRSEISTLMKKDLSQLVVTSWSNEQGLTSRIDILAQDVETARAIVTVVSSVQKGESCSSGTLCLCTRAYLEGENPSLSLSSSLSIHSLTLVTLSLLLISSLFQ